MTRVIAGSGDYVFEVTHPFGRPPPGMEFGNVSHVAVDTHDRVYLYRRSDPPVLVFDADGDYLRGWGDGQLLDAHGIYITPRDEIFFVDRDAHEVLKYDTHGQVHLRLGTRERPALQAPFNYPADVAVAPDGDIFVADGYGNSAVHRFSPTGEHRLSWGRPGSGPGEFTTPHGIWVDHQQRVYVVDRENHRVQIFDTEGCYLTEWRDLYLPMDIYVEQDHAFYVSDQIPRMTVFDSDGRILARFRTPYYAHGIWGDSSGSLYSAGNVEPTVKFTRLR